MRRLARIIAVVVAILIVAAVAPVGRAVTEIDSVTGSMRSRQIWLGGWERMPRVTPSPLQMRLNASGITWTPHWELYSQFYETLIPSFNCGRGASPPISHMDLPDFVRVSTDDELRAFVRIMESGTTGEKEAAARAAVETIGERLR